MTAYYLFYIYFFLAKHHGFDNKANLLVAAVNGAAYAAGSWAGERSPNASDTCPRCDSAC